MADDGGELESGCQHRGRGRQVTASFDAVMTQVKHHF